ncbi:hypothetical protein LPTSP4_33780 [Leptospira ryugenii]|uniref:Outer membrane protein n=1 Tax=Leptospira ryugenii TaxID=1917863 RepID=A0A2P2E4M8_9LEPT|nr:TMF family protein [Leptospira ryugenii]GBF51840.1 hypothetical protein LPTSP4_33780 [Leptospira ryugenii]
MRFLFFVLLTAFSFRTVIATEVEAVRLEEDLLKNETKLSKEELEEKRNRIKEIRKKNYEHPKSFEYSSGNQQEKILPPFHAGKTEIWGGFWEIGFRANAPFADHKSGQDWLIEEPEVAIQHGNFFAPRNYIGYQNQSVLPLVDSRRRVRPDRSVLPSFTFQYTNSKRTWSVEYAHTPLYGSISHSAYGLDFQYAKYESGFVMNEHKMTARIHEQFDKFLWFSWEFGLRYANWKSESSYLSPTLNQAGDMKETANFLAPGTGFRFNLPIVDFGKVDVGGEAFYTPLGGLDYSRRVFKDGPQDIFGLRYSEQFAYQIQSKDLLPMTVSGLEGSANLSLLIASQHRITFGGRLTGYTWRVNESATPQITAFGTSLALALQDVYRSSALYEADGRDGTRASRYFTVTNFYVGYNYVF